MGKAAVIMTFLKNVQNLDNPNIQPGGPGPLSSNSIICSISIAPS